MSFGGLDHGGMRDAPSSAPMADINMTPLIDVMLVLLVIFILTAPLLTHAIRLDLPRATSAAAADTPQTITVALDASGKLYWNDAPIPITQAELQARLSAAARSGAAGARALPELHLRADQAVPYRAVAAVMAAAQQAGLDRIGFVTAPAVPATGRP
jgi:biopolymer transport protein ExbD